MVLLPLAELPRIRISQTMRELGLVLPATAFTLHM
jgi:hypothetical protein